MNTFFVHKKWWDAPVEYTNQALRVTFFTLLLLHILCKSNKKLSTITYVVGWAQERRVGYIIKRYRLAIITILYVATKTCTETAYWMRGRDPFRSDATTQLV